MAGHAAALLAEAERLEADALDRTAAPLLPELPGRCPGLSIDLHLDDRPTD